MRQLQTSSLLRTVHGVLRTAKSASQQDDTLGSRPRLGLTYAPEMVFGISGQTFALGALMVVGTTMWAMDYKRDAAFELMM